MKLLTVSVIAALLAVSSAAAAGLPGPPHAPAPRLDQQGPPPAWVESTARSGWMAFSSYCWSVRTGASRKAVCADMIPPQSRNDLPIFTVRQRSLLRFHLGFRPREAHVTLFQQMRFTHDVLSPHRVLTWRAVRSGVISIDVRAADGEAAYLLRLRVLN